MCFVFCNFQRTKHSKNLSELATLHDAFLVYQNHNNRLQPSFDNFFQIVLSIHMYNTRRASKSTYINTIKTNFGKFDIRFAVSKTTLNTLQTYCQHS